MSGIHEKVCVACQSDAEPGSLVEVRIGRHDVAAWAVPHT